MARRGSIDAGRGHRVRFVQSDRTDGDFAPGAPGLDARRAVLCSDEWTWLEQVHGATVVRVREPGQHAGVRADAAVTTRRDAPVCVQTADCIPLLLVGAGGVAVVHAGWRGLLEDVVAAAAAELSDATGGGDLVAWRGPCIGPECYEFGLAELDDVVRRFGASVRGQTRQGTAALDLRAAVAVACAEQRIAVVGVDDRCTACAPDTWSHRARADTGRHTLVAWLEATT